MRFHVNENEKKNRKNLENENFEKKRKKKCSGDMVDRERPAKKSLPGSMQQFPRNLSLLTGGRMDEGRLRHNSSSADKVKQS